MFITLVCLVKGDTAANAFAVDIDSEKLISHLKYAIKANKAPMFDNFPADAIKVWKVEICVDDNQLSNYLPQNKDELPTTGDISDYWTENPPKKTIHVIVSLSDTASISKKEEFHNRLHNRINLLESLLNKPTCHGMYE